MNDIKLGGNYFIKCPDCGETIDYNETCKCGYSTFNEKMKQVTKQIEENEKKQQREKQSYKVFSDLMDSVFDLADQLNKRTRLTKKEEKLLYALDAYCADAMEEETN